MRFLVVTTNRESVPMEHAYPMMQMFKEWLAEHRASGKLEQVWSFAGIQGGGGIFDVDSFDELDEVMGGFPWMMSSNVQVYPIADLDAAVDNGLARMEQIMTMMAAAGND